MLEPVSIRPSSGRKAFRTVTAPSLTARIQTRHSLLSSAIIGDSKNNISKRDFVKSHLELVANKCRVLSGGTSGQIYPEATVINTFSEAKTLYGLRQMLKDVLESKLDSREHKLSNKHRREITRVWSREKITVTETRIYSRPPSLQNSKNNSQIGSLVHLQSSTNGSMNKIPRVVPLNIVNIQDNQNEFVSGSDRVLNVSEHIFDNNVLFNNSSRISNDISLQNSGEFVIPIKLETRIDTNVEGSTPSRPLNINLIKPIVNTDEKTIKVCQNLTHLPRVHFVSSEEPKNESIEQFGATQQVRAQFEPVVAAVDSHLVAQSNELSKHQLLIEPPSYEEAIFRHGYNSLPKTTINEPPTLSMVNDQIVLLNGKARFNLEEKQEAEMTSSTSTSVYTTAKSTPFGTASPGSPVYGSNEFVNFEPAQSNHNDESQSTNSSLNDSRIVNVNGESFIQQASYFRMIIRKDQTGYGFTVCGSNPVVVRSVRPGGTAEKAGLRPGDQIVKVNRESVETMEHMEVVAQIKSKPNVVLMLKRSRLIREETAVESMTGMRKEGKGPISEQNRITYEKRREARKQARLNSLKVAEAMYRSGHLEESTIEIRDACDSGSE